MVSTHTLPFPESLPHIPPSLIICLAWLLTFSAKICWVISSYEANIWTHIFKNLSYATWHSILLSADEAARSRHSHMWGLWFVQHCAGMVLNEEPHMVLVSKEECFQFQQSKQDYHTLSALVMYGLVFSSRRCALFPTHYHWEKKIVNSFVSFLLNIWLTELTKYNINLKDLILKSWINITGLWYFRNILRFL